MDNDDENLEKIESQKYYDKKVGVIDLLDNAQPRRKRNAYWTRSLRFAVYGSTLGSAVPLGYILGSINSPAEYIMSWCNETLIANYDAHLSEAGLVWLWSFVVSTFLVGGVAGSIIAAPMANKFGRRFSYYACGVTLLISGGCFYFCRMAGSVEMLFVGRFIGGTALGITISVLPMYHSELSLVEHRGSLAVFCPAGLTAGGVVAQIVTLQSLLGTEQHWHIALSSFVLPVIIFYIPYKLYPESPKWLYAFDGNRVAAETELKRLRVDTSQTAISEELELLEQEVNQKSKQSSNYSQVLRDPKLLLPTVIVCAFQGGQQLSGIMAIFSYSVSIFRKAGLSQPQASWANLAAGIINMTVAFFGPYLMRRFNRRPLMMISTIGCSIFLIFFSLLLQYIDIVAWFSAASIACMLLYILFFQLGIGPIPQIIGAELFEVAPRSTAMALGGFMATLCNFIVSMTFPTLQNLWGGYVFLLFSLTCFLLFMLTKYYLPETRGRDPTEISPLVENGFKSKVLINVNKIDDKI